MGLIAEYQITYRQLPLTDVATVVPGMTLDLTVGQPNQAGPPPFVVRATGEAFGELERALEASLLETTALGLQQLDVADDLLHHRIAQLTVGHFDAPLPCRRLRADAQ